MKDVSRLLGIGAGSRIAIIGPTPPAWRNAFVAAKAEVDVMARPGALARSRHRYDVVAMTRGTLGPPGAAMGAVAEMLPRLALEGVLLLSAPTGYESLGAMMDVPLGPQTGLLDRTSGALRKLGLQVLARPPLAEAERRTLARLLHVEGASRVAVLGWPLNAMPIVARLAPDAELFTPNHPGAGALDTVIFFAQPWIDGVGPGPALKQRLAHGGVLVFAFERRTMKPALAAAVLAPHGFEAIGKATPLPLSALRGDWLVQRFDLPRRAVSAPAKPKSTTDATKKTTPKRRVAASAAREIVRQRPAMPSLPAPSDDALGRKLQALLRPACVPAKTAALRGATPTSTVGPSTWARSGEGWPEGLEHRLSIRVDELPFVPDALAGSAFVSVFVGVSGTVVRTYDALSGLEPLLAPGRRTSEARAVRWRGVHDCPPDETASQKLRGRPSVADVEAARESDALDHYDGLKIGGWPSAIQGPPREKGFVLQLDGYGDEGLEYLYRDRGRWRTEDASY